MSQDDKLDANQAAEYLHRSYAAVDGLWFMKVEERFGFDVALDIDAAVWEVLPKLQARKLRDLTGCGEGLAGLRRCLAAKLELDRFAFSLEATEGEGFEVTIDRCPWQALLEKSGRVELGDAIGRRICAAEYRAWAREFGDDIRFSLRTRICGGQPQCTLCFSA